MTEPLYELAFYGRLVDGVNLDVAKSNVTKLFKASTAQVDKMFAGGRVVIRNKLDKATVDKYVAVMRKNGLVCEADLMGQKEAAPKAAAPQAKPTTMSTARPTSTVSPTNTSTASTNTVSAQSAPATSSAQPPSKAAEGAASSVAHSGEALKVLPLPSSSSMPEDNSDSHVVGFNLAGEEVDDILQKSHLNLDPEGVRLSEHQEVEPPVFSELEGVSLAPTGSDLVDPVEEIPPIIPDVSGISIAPPGSDMGQIKKDEKIEVPDLSHLKLDDLPDNQ